MIKLCSLDAKNASAQQKTGTICNSFRNVVPQNWRKMYENVELRREVRCLVRVLFARIRGEFYGRWPSLPRPCLRRGSADVLLAVTRTQVRETASGGAHVCGVSVVEGLVVVGGVVVGRFEG